MKKSCTEKESNVISTAEHALNDNTENPKELLSEEQLLINKKLLESGVDDKDLGWLEKRNIYRTIAASLDSSVSEEGQHSSSRSTKSHARWINNSFESPRIDTTCNGKEIQNNIENFRARSPILSVQTRKSSQGTEELKLTSTIKVEGSTIVEKKPENGERQNSILKHVPQVHFIKVEIEGSIIEECNSSNKPEATSHAVNIGKKRACCNNSSTETTKKLKMEESNNGVSSEDEIPLRIELEMEKRKQNAQFQIRDIESIVTECDVRNEKWKETYSKYSAPARWGTPIVKNCEKWDGKQIPQKLLIRYQKYLSSNSLTHPVFYPVNSQSSVDLNEFDNEMSSQSLTNINSECRNESDADSGERSFISESNRTLENNLSASTSGDSSSRMVLRNRNYGGCRKPIILDDEEYSSDEFDDWGSKQKPMKKKKTGGKNKKVVDQNYKQLFLKLEKCNINKRNGNEGRRSESKIDVGFTGSSMQINNSVNQDSKTGPDPDTMVCPICSLRFKKQLIESHATECASKTYKD